jgi:hypothetical protein
VQAQFGKYQSGEAVVSSYLIGALFSNYFAVHASLSKIIQAREG